MGHSDLPHCGLFHLSAEYSRITLKFSVRWFHLHALFLKNSNLYIHCTFGELFFLWAQTFRSQIIHDSVALTFKALDMLCDSGH